MGEKQHCSLGCNLPSVGVVKAKVHSIFNLCIISNRELTVHMFSN